MPRVENCGNNVDRWYCDKLRSHGNGSSTHDVCRDCAAYLLDDPQMFNHTLTPYNGDPVGDVGWVAIEADHPAYEECKYVCAVCARLLTDLDN